MKVNLSQEQAQEVRAQLNWGNAFNLAAISGGRIFLVDGTAVLPVSNGYRVEIDLDASDTYTVRRVFCRAGKRFVKGERTEVYCDDLGTAAYYASCFRSHDAETWPGEK